MGFAPKKSLKNRCPSNIFRVRRVGADFISVTILTFCFNKLPYTKQMTNFETILQNPFTSMLFSEIYGQNAIKQRLIKAVTDGHLPHAILLCGPEGTGKLGIAIALAQYLCCTDRKADGPCGCCQSCKQFAKLVHPDLHFVFPIYKEKSNDTTTCESFLPQWRAQVLRSPYFSYDQWNVELKSDNKQSIIYASESEEIIRKFNTKPYEADCKVMIIWLPEKMNETCANKLLKVLEEPPQKSYFIMVSENPEALLTTIISRTQRIFVPPLEEGDLKMALSKLYGLSGVQLEDVAHVSKGSLITAENVIQTAGDTKEYFDLFVSLMRIAYVGDARKMKGWMESANELGRKRQISFLAYVQNMVRENFIYNFGNRTISFMTADERAFATKFAPYVNELNIAEFLSELNLAQQHIEQNVQAKIVFFDLAMKVAVLLRKIKM